MDTNLPKWAIITGASSGIGFATAKLLATKGVKVINISRSKCELPDVINIETDLENNESLTHSLKEVKSILGKSQKESITVIHNAATYLEDSICNTNSELLTKTMQINVISPAIITKELKPLMAEGSSIIFIGSTLSEKAVPSRLSYVTSKHAVVGLMRSCVQDLFGEKIHTACICPGLTGTKMVKEFLENNPEHKSRLLENVSYNRMLEPIEIAKCIAFAVENPSVNGTIIHANLGQREI